MFSEPANNGYVKPELKVVVGDDASGMSSFPNTPQRTWQSPDHIREPASVSRYVSFILHCALTLNVICACTFFWA